MLLVLPDACQHVFTGKLPVECFQWLAGRGRRMCAISAMFGAPVYSQPWNSTCCCQNIQSNDSAPAVRPRVDFEDVLSHQPINPGRWGRVLAMDFLSFCLVWFVFAELMPSIKPLLAYDGSWYFRC